MPVAGGPFIQKTGILLEVDAANASSYSSGSSTWVNVFRPGTNNGTINGTVGFNSSDSYGALTFPGTASSFVDFGNIGNLSVSWSFQVAVKPAPSASGVYTILSYTSGSGTGSITYKLDYSSSIQSAILSAYSATGSTQIVHRVTGSVPTGSWSIINASYGNTILGMYVNGRPTDYTVTTGSTIGYSANNRLYLGGIFGTTSSFYTGSMASFFSYNSDVPNTQLIQNYNAYATRFGLPPSTLFPTSVDPDAFRFIEIANITDPTQASAIGNLVAGLKTYNLWNKMQAIYPFIGGTAFSHKWNLKDPRDLDSAFRILWFGGIIHTSQGVQTTSTNAYGDTRLLPSRDLLNVSSSAHITINLNTNSSASSDTVMGTSFNPRSGDYTSGFAIAQGWPGQRSTAAGFSAFGSRVVTLEFTGNGQGLWASTRVGNIVYGYRRSAIQNYSDSAGSLPYTLINNNTVTVLSGPGSTSAGIISNFASIGDGLTQTDVNNLYTLLNTYNTALSRL